MPKIFIVFFLFILLPVATSVAQNHIEKFPSDIQNIVFRDDIAYIATARHGIYRYNPFNKTLTPLPVNKYFRGTIQQLHWQDNETGYLATDKGLYIFSPDTIRKCLNVESGIVSDKIQSFELTIDGSIWAATDKGLFRYHSNDYQLWTTASGLPGNNIQFVKSDLFNRIWIISPDRIAYLDKGQWTLLNYKHSTGTAKKVRYILTKPDKTTFIFLDRWVGYFQGSVLRYSTSIPLTHVTQDPYGNVFGIAAGSLHILDMKLPVKITPIHTPQFPDNLIAEKAFINHLGHVYYTAKNTLIIATKVFNPSVYANALIKKAEEYAYLGEYAIALNYLNILRLYFPDQAKEPKLQMFYARCLGKNKKLDKSIEVYLTFINEIENTRSRLTQDEQKMYREALLELGDLYFVLSNERCEAIYKKTI